MLGVITPKVRCQGMPDPILTPSKAPIDTALVAIVAPRAQAAAKITEAWDKGEAVLVLDPAAPESARTELLAQLAPTHIDDGTGRRNLPDGKPIAAGTAAVVVTSGTSATPKGVELTTAGLNAIGAGFTQALTVTEADRPLLCLPLHHVSGLAVLARARFSHSEVIVHPKFDLAQVSRAPEEQGATIVSLVPTMLSRLLDAKAPLNKFRFVITGGAPLTESLRARAERQRVAVVDAYGLSETWGGCALNGRPLPGIEIRITQENRPDNTGEILVRGAPVMRQYRNDTAASERAFVTDPETGHSWLHTKDVGTFDPEGRLVVIDRLGDFVISGGVNVSPSAVEGALIEHPEVLDIAVGGRPDDHWGQQVVVYVVPRQKKRPPTLEDLQNFARRRLSAAQIPRDLVVCTEIPRTAGGKILRRRLAPHPNPNGL